MITSIARFLAAFFELVAEACLGSNNCDVSVISCLCDMDAPIPCVYVSRLALAAANVLGPVRFSICHLHLAALSM